MTDKPSATPTEPKESYFHQLARNVSEAAVSWVHDAVLGAPAKTLEPKGLNVSEPKDPPKNAFFREYIGGSGDPEGRGEHIRKLLSEDNFNRKLNLNADSERLISPPSKIDGKKLEGARAAVEAWERANHEGLGKVKLGADLEYKTNTRRPNADRVDVLDVQLEEMNLSDANRPKSSKGLSHELSEQTKRNADELYAFGYPKAEKTKPGDDGKHLIELKSFERESTELQKLRPNADEMHVIHIPQLEQLQSKYDKK